MVELLIGLIALSVLFLGLFLIGDLCRARMGTILDARREAGRDAIDGMVSGMPIFYGTMTSEERLRTEILNASDYPISYSQYAGGAYPYMLKNVVYPVYYPSGPTIEAFYLNYNTQSRDVQNTEFLVNMGVGDATITMTDRACLPAVQNFP